MDGHYPALCLRCGAAKSFPVEPQHIHPRMDGWLRAKPRSDWQARLRYALELVEVA